MKIKVPVLTEITIVSIRVELGVNYDEEDIPNDFPLRTGDLWKAVINIDTGEIDGWPKGQSGRVQMKVTDSGSYFLIDDSGKIVAKRESDYVPHGIIPGEYGDYVDLQINESGIITNWPKPVDLTAFFGED